MTEENKDLEVWVAIEGYEGIYEVSNLGKVKSLDRRLLMSNGGVKFIASKLLKGNLDSSGYLRVNLTDKDKNKKSWRIHRLVAIHFLSNENEYTHVNFKNEDRMDTGAENLYWTTLDVSNSKGGKNSSKKRTEREMLR